MGRGIVGDKKQTWNVPQIFKDITISSKLTANSGTTIDLSAATVTLPETAGLPDTIVVRGVKAETASGITLSNMAGTAVMTVTDGEKIGIGVTTPDSLLEVSGADDDQIKMTGASGVEVFMRPSASVGSIGTETSHDLAFRTGNTTQMTLDTSGNVGLGTTSPQDKLHVSAGAVRLDNDQGIFFEDTGGSASGGIKLNSSDVLTLRSGGAWDRMVIDASGKVGIGTTSPGARLAAKGAGGAYTLAAEKSGSTTISGIYEDGSGNHEFFLKDSAEATTVKFDTSGDSYFTGGNVGIGTSSPAGQLHISSGNLNDNILIESTDGGSAYGPELTIWRNSPSPLANDGLGEIKFDGEGSAGASHTYASINGFLEDPTNGSEDGAIRFFTSEAGSLGVKMTIDPSGNVGIGTTSPTDLLHVYEGASGATSNTYARIVLESDTHEALQFLTPNTQTQYIMFGDPEDDNAGQVAYSHSEDAMIFSTAGAQAMRIDSSGNVGIGTASPDNPLHSYSEQSIGANDVIQFPLKIEAKDISGDFWNRQGVGIQFENTASSGAFISAEIVGQTTSTAGTEGDLKFRTALSGTLVDQVIIESTGEMGIGTMSPATTLDVAGPIRPQSYVVGSVPDETIMEGAMIYVSNEAGGKVLAFSDGTNWLRVTDRAVITV